MAPPPQVAQWLQQKYPKPHVDPEWLDACYTWITDQLHLNSSTDLDKIIQNVESQLLQSNLEDSMLRGTGLPANVSQLDNTNLRGPPVLVEIVSITEIGHSAFSLQNTRQTRLDRADLTGLAADEAAEDDGPIPNYPRSMLRLQLSDGATIFEAMEYRPLPELQLGVTPLGYKMLLKDVFIRRGIGFLEPVCVQLIGFQTEDREAVQDLDFVRGLRIRLGKSEPEPENQHLLPHANGDGDQLPSIPAPRPPLPEIPEAPEPSAPGPSRIDHKVGEAQPSQCRISNPSSSSKSAPSPYFSSIIDSVGTSSTQVSNHSAILARERLLSPVRSGPMITGSDDESLKMGTGLVQEDASSDFGDDDMVIDDAMLQQIDQAEMEAMLLQAEGTTYRPPEPSSSSGTGSVQSSSVSSSSGLPFGTAAPAERKSTQHVVDIITIEDDEGDKENLPLPTQPFRRRTLEDDVIQISDSD